MISWLKSFDRDLVELSPWWRIFFLFWTLKILSFVFARETIPGLWNPLWVVSHGIHEIGHWVTMPFGMWVSVASGSIFQFCFCFVFFFGMLKHRDPHGAFVLLTWQAASVWHMAQYAGSAEYSDLVLDTPHYITLYHDWVWMLTALRAIHLARTIEDVLRFTALLFGVVSLAGQIWFLIRIFILRKRLSQF